MKNRITITAKSVVIENLEGAEAIVNVRKGDTVTEEVVFPNAVKSFALAKDTEIVIQDREFVAPETDETEEGATNE